MVEPRHSRLRGAAVVFVLAFTLFNSNLRFIGTGDSRSARFVPLALWMHGTVALDSLAADLGGGHSNPYWVLQSRQGNLISTYPLVTPLLVSPLYLPAVWFLDQKGWTGERVQIVAEVMEKVASSIVASASCALLFLFLRRRTSLGGAALLTLAYAAGTSTWGISSQALWQHGTAQLLLAVAFLALVDGPTTTARLVLGGVACGLLAANRPPDAVFAACFALHVLVEQRRKVLPFLASAAAAALPFFVYNVWTVHRLFGGYSLALESAPAFFSGPLLAGVAGLLVSPGKGLFVYSPFLVFLLWRPGRMFTEARHRLLAATLLGAIGLQLGLYGSTDFRGGYSYGARYATDFVPILIWLLVPAVTSLGLRGRIAFGALVALAIGVQVIGAYRYPQGASDIRMYATLPAGAEPTRTVWSVENSPILVEARASWAPMTYLPYLK